jgi:hypothetical protein
MPSTSKLPPPNHFDDDPAATDYSAAVLLLRHVKSVAFTDPCNYSSVLNDYVVSGVASRTKCFEIIVCAIGRDF